MLDKHSFDAHIHVEKPGVTPETVLMLARERGLTVGLVDHVFAEKERITPQAIKLHAREQFSDLHFLHGCEADAYFPGKIALSQTDLKVMDYVIISFTHLGLSNTLDGISMSDNSAIGTRIMELLETAVDYQYTDVIAHPFSFSLNGVDSWEVIKTIPAEAVISQLQRIKKRKILVEVNARTLRNIDARPQEYFIQLANKAGCCFSIASDAHELEDVGRTKDAWVLIDKLGISHDRILFPKE